MMNPTITVCVPNYNHGAFIAGALKSVLTQSFTPSEIVVVDDASADDSVAIVERIARDNPLIRLIVKPENRGVFDSVNSVLRQSTSEFFYVLAADDEILPGFFQKSISHLRQYASAGMCASAIRFIDPKGRVIPPDRLPTRHTHATHAQDAPQFLSPEQLMRRLQKQPWFLGGVAGVIFRRVAFAEAGGLRPDLALFADWYAPHYVALKYGMCFLPETLAAFRIMPDSYGASIVKRPRAFLENAAATLRLMRDENADVFPPAFVERMRSDFTYAAFRGALANWQTGFANDVLQCLPATGFGSRLLLTALDFLRKAQLAAVKFYCRGRVAAPLRG